MFDKISTALLSLFSANTRIQSKYNFEASNLEGFPALTLTPSGDDNNYSTTTENRRVYAFMVRLYVERGSGLDAERTCEATMRDLVDTILDTVDKNHSAISISTPGFLVRFVNRHQPAQNRMVNDADKPLPLQPVGDAGRARIGAE